MGSHLGRRHGHWQPWARVPAVDACFEGADRLLDSNRRLLPQLWWEGWYGVHGPRSYAAGRRRASLTYCDHVNDYGLPCPVWRALRHRRPERANTYPPSHAALRPAQPTNRGMPHWVSRRSEAAETSKRRATSLFYTRIRPRGKTGSGGCRPRSERPSSAMLHVLRATCPPSVWSSREPLVLLRSPVGARSRRGGVPRSYPARSLEAQGRATPSFFPL
jgi:hypothetical protein